MYSLKVLCLCGNVAFRIGRISRNRSVLFWLTREKKSYYFFVFVLLLKVSNTILSGGLLQSRSDCSLIKTFMTIWKKPDCHSQNNIFQYVLHVNQKIILPKKCSSNGEQPVFKRAATLAIASQHGERRIPFSLLYRTGCGCKRTLAGHFTKLHPLRFLVFPILQLPGMVVPLHRTLTDAFLIKHRPLAMISNFREVPMFKIGFANWIGFFEKKYQAFLLICRKNWQSHFLPQFFMISKIDRQTKMIKYSIIIIVFPFFDYHTRQLHTMLHSVAVVH